jgi:release factor glutamine methyltransferase
VLKKIARYFVGRVYKPVLARYLSGTRRYSYKGIRLIIPPEVFHPAFFFSTKVLLKYLDKQPLQDKAFLELGAGSGLIAFFAAKKGAIVTASDINPIAVEYLQRNRALNNNLPVEIILSDLFTNIPPQAYDVIAVNPPYFKKNPQSPKDYAWYCGEQGEYFDRFFKYIGHYLHSHSRVLMILSTVCNLDMIHTFAEKHGWSLNIVHTHTNWLEQMLLYELAPLHHEVLA